MSILIKGMEMTEKCIDCPCRDINDDCVLQSAEMNASSEDWDGLKANCPLVRVPPHGRLIDAHALHTAGYEVFEKYADKPDAREALKEIEKLIIGAPTVIAVEEGI